MNKDRIGQSAAKTQINIDSWIKYGILYTPQLISEVCMKDWIEETSSGIYRVTPEGKIYSQSKLKIPIVGKGMEHTGEFKRILKPERELTYTLNVRGYYSVVIMKKTHMVHRLVAKAFIPNPEGKPQVNHIDGNKLNNHYLNLEWCTAQENIQHAFQTGLNKGCIGMKRTYKDKATKQKCLANLKDKSKLTPDEVRYVRKVFIPRHPKYSATALAKQFGTSIAAMSKIVKGQTYKNVV